MGKAVIDRFESKVMPEPNSGCWLWIGAAGNGSGRYGNINISGKPVLAHRFSYLHHIGEIPAGMNVLHSCDNDACVNPRHLFLGTQADNMIDKVTKNRQLSGEDVSTAKLSKSDVKRILASEKSGAELARRYGVSDSAISLIKSGKNWRSAK